MRIVSGSARGKKLVPFSGQDIRPTSDRIREAVFSSLYSRLGPLQGCRILDLYAGTGAMGIEALSRGATSAVFVDSSAQALRIIRKNLELCGLLDKGVVLHRDIPAGLSLLEEVGPFDLIFLDPPYGKGLVEKTLRAIGAGALLNADGLVCAEAPAGESLDGDFRPLAAVKTCRYGSTRMHFFQIPDEGANDE